MPADTPNAETPAGANTASAVGAVVLGAFAFLVAVRVGFRSLIPTVGG